LAACRDRQRQGRVWHRRWTWTRSICQLLPLHHRAGVSRVGGRPELDAIGTLRSNARIARCSALLNETLPFVNRFRREWMSLSPSVKRHDRIRRNPSKPRHGTRDELEGGCILDGRPTQIPMVSSPCAYVPRRNVCAAQGLALEAHPRPRCSASGKLLRASVDEPLDMFGLFAGRGRVHGRLQMDDYIDVAERNPQLLRTRPPKASCKVVHGVGEAGGSPFCRRPREAYRTPEMLVRLTDGMGARARTDELHETVRLQATPKTAAWGRALVALGV